MRSALVAVSAIPRAAYYFTNNISMGLEYLYTQYTDDDYVVNVGPGTAGATNPFLLASGGTDMKRSDSNFDQHSIRLTAALRF